jgi:hypothetical protein
MESFVNNCQYCGLWNCTADAPICDDQLEGKAANHPCRAFKAGDWVEHPEYGVGQISFVKPIEEGLRITFNDLQRTDWYSVDNIEKINDTIFPAKDMDGSLISVGDVILYPIAKGGAGNGACICRGTVVEIAKECTHRGYGYYTRYLKIKPKSGGKVFTHNYPNNCMVVL